MPDYARSDLDWYSRSELLPTRPQFSKSYDWHFEPAWTDPAALEARAAAVEAERHTAETRMFHADNGTEADWPEYDAAAEDFALADRELEMLRKRIEDLEGGW